MRLKALLPVQETHATRSAKQRFIERDNQTRNKSRAVVESLATQRASALRTGEDIQLGKSETHLKMADGLVAEQLLAEKVTQPVQTNLTAAMLLQD